MTEQRSPQEIEALYWQRPEPTPIPAPGQVVHYRHHPGGPLLPAGVVEVAMGDRADPNVWTPQGTVRRDPAPLVLLEYRAFGPKGETVTQRAACREARVPGQPGWTWPPPGVVPELPAPPARSAADGDSGWYLIVTGTRGRHIYPIAYTGDPDDKATQELTAAQVAAAVAAHRDLGDELDVQITHGEPHPGLQAVRHDQPPSTGD